MPPKNSKTKVKNAPKLENSSKGISSQAEIASESKRKLRFRKKNEEESISSSSDSDISSAEEDIEESHSSQSHHIQNLPNANALAVVAAAAVAAANANAHKKKKTYKKRETKKEEVVEVEVISIRYSIEYPNHPNYLLNDDFDTCPLNKIIGYGSNIEKNQVKFFKIYIYEILNFKMFILKLTKGTNIMVLKNNFPTPAVIDVSFIWKIKESEVIKLLNCIFLKKS